MQRQSTEMGNEQFATIAVNLLHKSLIEADRTSAKRIFRELEEGRPVTLTRLKFEDGGLVRIDVSLDAQAFRGTFNFSAFRDGVLALLAQLTAHLKAENPLVVYHALTEEQELAPEYEGSRLFGVAGGTVHDGVANALMLGTRPHPEQPVVTLLLTYVDPQQFQASSTS